MADELGTPWQLHTSGGGVSVYRAALVAPWRQGRRKWAYITSAGDGRWQTEGFSGWCRWHATAGEAASYLQQQVTQGDETK